MSNKIGPEYRDSLERHIVDKTVASVLAGVATPALIGALAATAVETPGESPVFTQFRVCRFVCRSMQYDPEIHRAGDHSTDCDIIPEMFSVAKVRTLPNGTDQHAEYGTFDPRASHIGAFLRQTGVDELTQIFQVVRGNMSLLGRRPLTIASTDAYEKAASNNGQTGLYRSWQEKCGLWLPGLISTSGLDRKKIKNGSPEETAVNTMIADIDEAEKACLQNDLRLIFWTTPLAMSPLIGKALIEAFPRQSHHLEGYFNYLRLPRITNNTKTSVALDEAKRLAIEASKVADHEVVPGLLSYVINRRKKEY